VIATKPTYRVILCAAELVEDDLDSDPFEL
jgi:hypothetical protein